MIKLLFFLLVILTCTGMLIYFFSLKKHKKNVNPEDYFIGSQLILAKTIKEQNVEAVKKLAKETDLNTPAKKDITILFFAFNKALDNTSQKSLEIITELVKAGADAVNYEVPNLGSVWGVSLTRPEPEFAKALLDGGISPNSPSKGKGSRSGLFECANERSFKVMELLIQRGANLDTTDSVGNSVLYHSLTGMQFDQTKYLLKSGANPSVHNRLGVSFAWSLQNALNKTKKGSPREKILQEIKTLAQEKGMIWPPTPPEQERDNMRSRGEEPVVPYGMRK
jgi:uncharacterized protein